MKKALIGIVSKYTALHTKQPKAIVSNEIKNALFSNGANTIGLLSDNVHIYKLSKSKKMKEIGPHVEYVERENFKEQIALCDGIVLEGGDISYEYEMWIAKYCHTKNIPLLGICAGYNNIVRAHGGTLKLVEDEQLHHNLRNKYAHHAFINKDSFLHSIIKEDKIKVNSRHVYIAKVVHNLSVAAVDDFGDPEVVEDKSKLFYMGIKFHPESLYTSSEACNNIFKHFVKACEKRKQSK